MRIVCYINQFFAGVGGEDKAGVRPEVKPGAVGPLRRLEALLGGEHEVVATVYCGDDYAAGQPGAIEEILALVQKQEPELLVAGPAFTSGRYGFACARLVAAASAEGLTAVAAMHDDNPGAEEAGGAPVVRSGRAAREMGPSLERLAQCVKKLARKEELTPEDGRIGKIPRRGVWADKTAAERAVDLALAHLAGERTATEVPAPAFDRVAPAQPIADPSEAVIALLTEGALVPVGNPDALESARATRWVRYPLQGDELDAAAYNSVHGGFSTVWANEDPHRILPLDAARELEREGAIGRLHAEYFVTAGNGTSVGNARRFGVEWAAELRRAGVQAAILTST